MNANLLPLSLALGIVGFLPACSNHHTAHHEHYAPGLGEIMAQSAVRHAKLWFAGRAQNWELAAYEIDELHEGFEDAGKFHPNHKHIRQPIPELITDTMEPPLAQLEKAIEAKNLAAFTETYDQLTAGCNACHQRTDFGFNIVTRPSFNPFANQAFETQN